MLIPFLFIHVALAMPTSKPISAIPEDEAWRRSEQAVADFGKMRLVFGEEWFKLGGMEQKTAERTNVITGFAESEDSTRQITVTLKKDERDPSTVTIFDEAKGTETTYKSKGPIDEYQVEKFSTFHGNFEGAGGEIKVMNMVIKIEVLANFGNLMIELEDSGRVAYVNGELGIGSLVQMSDFIEDNPDLEILQLENMPGSLDDDYNLYIGRLVRQSGLSTRILKDGNINSGAVDLFTAGVRRYVEPGAHLGVHSWCCPEAASLPKDAKAHQYFINYLTETLGSKGKDFYFFTIYAAPHAKVKAMTMDEMWKYGVVTDEI